MLNSPRGTSSQSPHPAGDETAARRTGAAAAGQGPKARATGRWWIPVGLLAVGGLSAYVMMDVIPAPGWLWTVAVCATFLCGGWAAFTSVNRVREVARRQFGRVGGDVVFCVLAVAPLATITVAIVRRWDVSALAIPAALPFLPFVTVYAAGALAVVLFDFGKDR